MKQENLELSVLHSLKELSQKRNEDYQLILTRYAIERFLYRLSCSKHQSRFILKGAMLLFAHTKSGYRPTRDLDLLGFGAESESSLKKMISEICMEDLPNDGVSFLLDTVTIIDIREESAYEGKRVKLQAHIGKTRIPIQIDIAFGDAVFPEPEIINYPTLLSFPEPHIRAYPLEAIIAEKIEAMISLGIINSRMKDIYDVYTLLESYSFKGKILSRSIAETFTRRKTALPENTPLVFSKEFADDNTKKKQWAGFLKKTGLSTPGELDEVLKKISTCIQPIIDHLQNKEPFTSFWSAGGPWNKDTI
jgi:predicted nucleotidyltransferase component of viral defense system